MAGIQKFRILKITRYFRFREAEHRGNVTNCGKIAMSCIITSYENLGLFVLLLIEDAWRILFVFPATKLEWAEPLLHCDVGSRELDLGLRV